MWGETGRSKVSQALLSTCRHVDDLIVGLTSMRVGCRIYGVSINDINNIDDMVKILLSSSLARLAALSTASVCGIPT